MPNVIYLLVFDRELAEKIVTERYPSEGPHYLEKIIQAGFEIPAPIQTDLNDEVLKVVGEICGTPRGPELTRFMNLFYDVVVPYISTPRHVARLRNTIAVTWPAIGPDVNIADFVALETIRLYEPALFNAIRANKNKLCGVRGDRDPGRNDLNRFAVYLENVPGRRHALSKIALQRLFPRLDDVTYGGDWLGTWSSERRICVEVHFDTYFHLTLSDDALHTTEINELIERADDADFIKDTFRNAAENRRKNGKSLVPVYLDELTNFAPRIEKSKVAGLLSALFEIHDDIDLAQDDDRGFMAHANTSLRFYWLILRLTRERFSIEERTQLYLAATEKASLGWIVDFASRARHDYSETRSTREEDCLVTRNALEALTSRALEAIHAAVENRSLLGHRDLVYILYRWREFTNNDPTEVRTWTDSLISNVNRKDRSLRSCPSACVHHFVVNRIRKLRKPLGFQRLHRFSCAPTK